jgi:tetratricopeptide (TPR) repeat protein
MRMGKLEEALQKYLKALAILQQLVDDNPAVAAFQRELAVAYYFIGNTLSKTGKLDEAIQAHLKGVAIKQKLLEANPTVPFQQRDLAYSQESLGRLLARQKRFAEAFTTLDAALAMRRKLTETDPKDTRYASELGGSYAYRGCALVRSGSADGRSKAAADLRRALELWSRREAPESEDRFERSRVLAVLAGLAGEANSGVTKEEAAAYADQAVAALADAVKAGSSNWADLKEPDFDAIRQREDFKKLAAEMEAKFGPKAKRKG